MSKINYITPIGDDFIINLNFFMADGVTPEPINGDTIKLILKKDKSLADNDASNVIYQANVVNASTGVAYFQIPDTDAINYSGTYYYKAVITVNGNITTFAYGVITFSQAGVNQAATMPNSLSINISAGVTMPNYYTWQTISGTSQALVTGQAYIPTNTSLTTFTLPASAAIGDHFIVSGQGSGGWKVAQNASQQIVMGDVSTTSGTGGSLASTQASDIVEIVCVGTNQFKVNSSFGNITVT